MRAARLVRSYWLEVVALTLATVVFVIPFAFMFLTAAKTQTEAARLEFSLPSEWRLLENIGEVLEAQNGIVLVAVWNSLLLTVGSVSIIVVLSAMVGFVLQRRRDRLGTFITALMLAGLIIPPALVPTIYVLQWLNLFNTLPGLILVMVTQQMPFSVIVIRAFVSAIPRELDEAVIIDGAYSSHLRLLTSE